jgi:putative ABC transport system ATP-binding protein
LRDVMLADDIYVFGLRGRMGRNGAGASAGQFLAARGALQARLTQGDLAGLVEPFDPATYNRNATVAENLLFGTPVGDTFDTDELGSHPYVRKIMDDLSLTEDFFEIGKQVAETMVELFADFDASHELTAQFSFISPEDLPEFQATLSRINRAGGSTGTAADRDRLISLPFRLSPERHRLGLIDARLQVRLLEARKRFAAGLPDDLKDKIAFFDPAAFNPAGSLQDNLLFGKIAYGRPQAEAQVRAAMGQILVEFDLVEATLDIGLDFQVGVGGSRLSAVQRQKLAIARAMLKHADLLILNNPFAPFDEALRRAIMDNILTGRQGRGLVAVMDHPILPERFDRVFVAEHGRVEETIQAGSTVADAAQ